MKMKTNNQYLSFIDRQIRVNFKLAKCSLYLILLSFTLITLNGCSEEETRIPEESVMTIVENFESLDDLTSLEGRDLDVMAIAKLDERLSDLGLVEKREGGQRHAICGGLVFYPNGNDTPPCEFRHKVTYLDDKYEEYEGDSYLYAYFAFELDGCTEYVIGGPSLYNYECTLQSAGEHVMTLYFYGLYVNDEGLLDITSRRVCTKTYECGL